MQLTGAIGVNGANSNGIGEDGKLADRVHPALHFLWKANAIDLILHPSKDAKED
jgi:hypothetical protein